MTRKLGLAVGCAVALVSTVVVVPGSAATPSAVTVDVNPPLFPRFHRHVPDYVTRCVRGKPPTVSVSAPSETPVSVDGRAARTGSSVSVPVSTGQSFRIVLRPKGASRETYSVRCLPRDFPRFAVERAGRPQAQWYVVTPSLGVSASTAYVAIFDRYGVPAWWYDTHNQPFDASLLSNGDIVWAQQHGHDISRALSAGFYEQFRLDGRRVNIFKRTGGPTSDRHDFQILPNGHRVFVSYVPRDNVDLSPWGGPRRATVLDALVQEQLRNGKVIWSWNSKHWIHPAESARWLRSGNLSVPAPLPDGRKAYDIVHINSVARYGPRRFLLSFRHTDSIYAVSRRTKRVVWKIGGTRTPESLDIKNDPDAGTDFGGQHDARALGDGSITVHDNGTMRDRAPRALRFRLDERKRTATEIERIADPDPSLSSPCCGSARRLPGGDWVMSWGGTALVTELAATGARVFGLRFDGMSSYRAFPVLPGRLSRTAIRARMDAMHPRSRRAH